MENTARLYHCTRCHAQVFICRRCDRGNIYCASGCAREARQQSLSESGRRYQQTRRGRRHHAARQQRYRARQKQKVTHQGSLKTEDRSPLSLPKKQIKKGPAQKRCHFCQRQIASLVRTGFLHHIFY